jgi:predicted MFS family arabinose efflux permease
MVRFRSDVARLILSTRITYFAAGFGIAAWAPLIPLVKARLHVSADIFGFFLLCLGLGSILAMPVTGAVVSRFGCARVIAVAGTIAAMLLPALANVTSKETATVILFAFGAAIGTVDVGMNIQAVEVERRSGRMLMPVFHGFFSLGGMAGAAFVSLLMSSALTQRFSGFFASLAMASLLAFARNGWLGKSTTQVGTQSMLALPRGSAVTICLLCLVVGVVEGSIIDWSAIYLTEARDASAGTSGMGYAAFAAAMTLNRFFGSGLIRRMGSLRVFSFGAIAVACGFTIVVFGPSISVAIAGFLVVGIGMANLVPILCSRAGRQDDMPPGHAVAAVVTSGYAGIMLGPALIGSLIHRTSLSSAFIALAVCAFLLAAFSTIAFTRRTPEIR